MFKKKFMTTKSFLYKPKYFIYKLISGDDSTFAETKFNNMKNVTLGCAVLFVSLNSYCQVKLTDFRVSTQFLPSSNYLMPYKDTTSLTKTTEYAHDRTDSKTHQTRLNLEMNFDLSTKIDTTDGSVKLWKAMINSDHMFLDHTSYSEQIIPTYLSTTSISVQHIRSLKKRWMFMTILSAGVNSDYKKIDGNDIFVFAGGLWVKSFSTKFSLGVGVMVHNNFGKPMPWPLITANWELGKKLKLNIDVPDKAPGLAYRIGLTYVKSERFDASLFFKPSSLAYDIDYSADNKRLLNYWQIPIGTEIQTHTKHIDLSFNYGLMALRSFGYADKQIAKMFAKYPFHQLSAQMFFGFNIKYKF